MNTSIAAITISDIYSDLLDGYTPFRLATMISHSDDDKGLDIANKAYYSFSKDSYDSTDMKNMHDALDWIYGGLSADDLASDADIDYDTAKIYIYIINTPFK